MGLHTSTANNDFSMSMFGKSQDPANRIYMSAAALRTVLDASDKKNPFENMIGGASDYITQVNSAMNLTVIFRMLGVGLLLTLVQRP